MPTIQADKEQIRMLVASIGYQDTAKQTGIKPNTLYQWARRFQWNTPIPHSQKTVTTVRTAPEVLESELQQNEKQTRLSLSRYTARAAKDAELATLRDAKLVKAIAETADKTYPGWLPDKGKDQSQVAVNIAILGV